MRFYQKHETYFEVHMLINNRIPGVATARTGNVDNTFYLEYDECGYSTFSEAGQELLTETRRVVSYGAVLESRLKEFMISPDHIVLTPEAIFLDQKNRSVQFCIDPSKESTLAASLNQLFSYIIKQLSHRSSRETQCIYDLYALTEESHVTFAALSEALRQASGYKKDRLQEPEEDPLFKELGLSLSLPEFEEEDEKTVLLEIPETPSEPALFSLEEPAEEPKGILMQWVEKAKNLWKKYTFEICILAATLLIVLLLLLL